MTGLRPHYHGRRMRGILKLPMDRISSSIQVHSVSSTRMGLDSELAVAPNDDLDDDSLIRSVQFTTEWYNFRQQLADDMFAKDMNKDIVDALKTTEHIPPPKVTTPIEILDALQLIPDLAEHDILRCYGKLVLNDRLFQAQMEPPITMRKTWLLKLP
uniref:Uncharacterized protein n=1 Tax=Aegilops tauschii TaxID=37682 RepID=R7W8Z3_AEGTA